MPGVQVVNITASQLIKQWKTFLSQVKNKTSLIRFLVEEWQTKQFVQRIQRNRKELYVTCEEKCWRISGDRTVKVPELCSCQEEAVTRLLLRAKWLWHSVGQLRRYRCVCTASGFFQKCGSTRLIDIKRVTTIGKDVFQALVGLYSFTWCDTVGAFADKGKLIALKIVKSDTDAKQPFTELGQSWNLSEDLFWVIEKVTCCFYSSGTNASDVNDLSYKLFLAKNREIESHQTALESTPCGQTIKRAFGGVVCSVAHQSTTQLDSDGRWGAQRKTNQVWQLTGWMESLLPRQCWSFLHAVMPQIVQAFRLCLILHGERPNMYTDLCWLQDCEN